MIADDIAIAALHVLGAALYVGGAFGILATNRALRRRLPDAERRDMVRYLGRAGAPLLAGGLTLAAITGLWHWWARGWTTRPLMLAKIAMVLLAALALGAHVWLGRREGRRVAVAAALGMATLVSALGLVLFGVMLRYL